MAKNKLSILLWIARVTAIVALGILLFFVGAHIFGNNESGDGIRSVKELMTFACFPVGTIIGLAIALKWEGLGGLISVASLLVLFLLLRPNLINSPSMLVFSVPGLLFLAYWFLNRSK